MIKWPQLLFLINEAFKELAETGMNALGWETIFGVIKADRNDWHSFIHTYMGLSLKHFMNGQMEMDEIQASASFLIVL